MVDTGTYFYTEDQLVALVHSAQLDAIRGVLAPFADGIEKTTIPAALESETPDDYKAGAIHALNGVVARSREAIQEIDKH